MRRRLTLGSIVALASVAALVSGVACSADDSAASPGERDLEEAGGVGLDACSVVTTGACAPASGDDSSLVGDDSGFQSDGALVGAGCVIDSDCDGGRCGYSILSGCAATGICVTPDVPLVDGAPQVACGCDGQDVSFVTGDLTSAPVSSLSPCVDAGALDGSVDGASEAATPTDASDSG